MNSFLHSIFVIFSEKVKRFFLPMIIVRANVIGLWAGLVAAASTASKLRKNR